MYQHTGISTIHPVQPAVYRRYDDDGFPLFEEDIPQKPEDRRTTDRWFLVVFIVCVIALMPFLIYTLVHSDIRRFTEDIDTYSNENFSSQYLGSSERNNALSAGAAWKMAISCCVPLVLCLVLSIMFRKATAVAVWFILIVSWLYFLAVTIALWCLGEDAIGGAVVFTIFTVILLVVLIFMRNKIRLVIMLFREAATAIFDMRAIFSVPVAAIFVMLIIAAAFITTTVYISTARISDENGTYFSNVMMAAAVLNFIIAYWAIEFLFGIQYMMVSGAVTKWFFTRNKAVLVDPVYNSIVVTLKNHLGTVALASLIITLMSILRMLIRSLLQNSRTRLLVECCLRPIENLLKFFTKNAYIVTAMHGTPFCKSGVRAVKLLTMNICNTVAVTSIGDFVIAMSYFFITGVSVGINVALFKGTYYETEVIINFYAVIVSSLICCFTILGTFETAFSTTFLCTCQDFALNNGAEKPYAMTKNMMVFLDESKRVYQTTISKQGLPTI